MESRGLDRTGRLREGRRGATGKEFARGKCLVAQIRKAVRRKYSAEKKIRLILDGLRGEIPISELCRREGLAGTLLPARHKSAVPVARRAVDSRRTIPPPPTRASGPSPNLASRAGLSSAIANASPFLPIDADTAF